MMMIWMMMIWMMMIDDDDDDGFRDLLWLVCCVGYTGTTLLQVTGYRLQVTVQYQHIQ